MRYVKSLLVFSCLLAVGSAQAYFSWSTPAQTDRFDKFSAIYNNYSSSADEQYKALVDMYMLFTAGKIYNRQPSDFQEMLQQIEMCVKHYPNDAAPFQIQRLKIVLDWLVDEKDFPGELTRDFGVIVDLINQKMGLVPALEPVVLRDDFQESDATRQHKPQSLLPEKNEFESLYAEAESFFTAGDFDTAYDMAVGLEDVANLRDAQKAKIRRLHAKIDKAMKKSVTLLSSSSTAGRAASPARYVSPKRHVSPHRRSEAGPSVQPAPVTASAARIAELKTMRSGARGAALAEIDAEIERLKKA